MRKRPEAVYAYALEFHLNEDRGESREVFNEEFTNPRTRGISIHPNRPEIILISASPNGSRFALFRAADNGKHWEKVTNGFPDSSESENDTHGMVF